MNRLPIPGAYYAARVQDFLATSSDAVLGALTAASEFSIEPAQRDAWLREVNVLRECLRGISGVLYLEYVVPRIGSRIDAVLVTHSVIVPIEFKVGEREFRRDGIDQVWDYALDLRNFHQASDHAPIIPILVATESDQSDENLSTAHFDGVRPPVRASATGLSLLIERAIAECQDLSLDPMTWGRALYRPTPTILQAARALYSQHSVEAIARNDAGAQNLSLTATCVEEIIEEARTENRKIMVLVTGVPGAGKTLVGLDVATKNRQATIQTHAVFLSGNAPLVLVLREALTRDEVARLRNSGNKTRKGDVAQRVKAFIQHVHHFRDDGLRSDDPPSDHVAIFDEAQRAWNRGKTADFMKRKKGKPDFSESEPEFLIGCMNRHVDWAVVVCLVGGGQEIHSGEAGIEAWLDAIRERFPDWRVYLSPHLTDQEYAAGQSLSLLSDHTETVTDPRLHLAVSMRSFRAENVSQFVKAVLDLEETAAIEQLRQLANRFPIAITRDLPRAKDWVRSHARGTERYGLVASSGAMRLRPHAVDVRINVDPIHYFLDGRDDTRSSFYLEDAATEFQIQGLELDWVCVNWDADLRRVDSRWSYHSFRRSAWENINKTERRRNLLNSYRVLLTRARQGMIIFVPPGDISDRTRLPKFYDGTYTYLRGLGIAEI